MCCNHTERCMGSNPYTIGPGHFSPMLLSFEMPHTETCFENKNIKFNVHSGGLITFSWGNQFNMLRQPIMWYSMMVFFLQNCLLWNVYCLLIVCFQGYTHMRAVAILVGLILAHRYFKLELCYNKFSSFDKMVGRNIGNCKTLENL